VLILDARLVAILVQDNVLSAKRIIICRMVNVLLVHQAKDHLTVRLALMLVFVNKNFEKKILKYFQACADQGCYQCSEANQCAVCRAGSYLKNNQCVSCGTGNGSPRGSTSVDACVGKQSFFESEINDFQQSM